ncbi:unnamed protein product [Cuscuta campestris]|uniref:Uncharacterized protein n=1 Tax=Cuscuta campestris TaxID=132261 RepID=A0A484MTU0_9ASTE|nr:unnamed protein product [Cuscuta campestris]
MRNPILENLLGLNLNLPPASRNPITPEMIVVNHEPIVGDNHIEYIMSSHYKELVELAIEGTSSMKEEELKFPITNSLIVGFHSKRQPALRAKRGSSIWYPGIYMQVSASIAPPLMPHINVDESAQVFNENSEVELALPRKTPRSTVHVANEKPPFRALPLRPHYDFFFMAIDVVDKSSIVTTAADLESREEIDTLRGFEGDSLRAFAVSPSHRQFSESLRRQSHYPAPTAQSPIHTLRRQSHAMEDSSIKHSTLKDVACGSLNRI